MLLHRNLLFFVTYFIMVNSIEDCEEDPDINNSEVGIVNLTKTINFDLPNGKKDLTSHNLTVTFRWEVETLEESDDDENSNYFSDESTYEEKVEERYYSLDICSKYIGKQFWVTDSNGTYRSCKFPCEDYVNCVPVVSVCNKLAKSECKPLDKASREITLPLEFYMKYHFKIETYKDLSLRATSLVSNHDTLRIQIYCSHHLVENEKLPRQASYDLCKTFSFSDDVAFTSPIRNFSVNNVSYDLDSNKTTIDISWMTPHDVKDNKKISQFNIFSSTDKLSIAPETVVVGDKEGKNFNSIFAHKITQSGVSIEKVIVRVSIFPFYVKPNCTLECDQRGHFWEDDFAVEGFAPCDNQTNEPFCDSLASCRSFPNPKNFSDWCQCQPGYEGDGVTVNRLKSAKGCKAFDACSPTKPDICVSTATCFDAPPPSFDALECRCPALFHGDGRKLGLGCSPFPIILIVSGLFLVILFVLAVLLRIRRRKERLLSKALSQFVSRSSDIYFETSQFTINESLSSYLLSINNHNNHFDPVFGSKLEIDRSSLTMQEIIGRGNFGVVRKAILAKNGTKQIVAVKSLTDTYLSELQNEFLAEISLLLHLGEHENILGVIGVCTAHTPEQSNDRNAQSSPLLVSEYMIYGDLLHFLWNARELSIVQQNPIYDFTEKSLFHIGCQVAHGLEFMSKSRVIHGDVAARNVLLGENLQAKISDFGLANDVYRYGLIKASVEKKVPFKWVSPERMTDGKIPITWKSDVWSFGILLYEMVTLGAPPYPGMEPAMILNRLRSGYRIPQPSSCSDYLYKIMMDCWQWDASKRPGFNKLEELLKSGKESANATEAQSLLRRIDHLDEVNLQSYNRIVERRNSLEIGTVIMNTSALSRKTSPNSLNSNQFVIPHDLVEQRDGIVINKNVNLGNGQAHSNHSDITQ